MSNEDKRLFRMMLPEEVEKEVVYRDTLGLRIIVQAGVHGFSIIYADNSTIGYEIDDTTENNFNRALSILKEQELDITEDSLPNTWEICSCANDRSNIIEESSLKENRSDVRNNSN